MNFKMFKNVYAPFKKILFHCRWDAIQELRQPTRARKSKHLGGHNQGIEYWNGAQGF